MAATLASRGVLGLRRALERGEFTCVTLLEDCLRVIGERDDAINAVIALDGAGAMESARAADARRRAGAALGPLDGLPFGVKDNIDVAGFVTTGGLGPRASAAPVRRDAPAVARLRAAGAIPLAKLNLHEAALGASNHNVHHGHCYNPLAPDSSPGGSSGGSAAAVAAGYLPFALGTDTMGSLRIPAAYCGNIGFKASFGRIPTGGTLVVSRRLDHLGPIASQLEDLPLLLAALSVHQAGDPWSRAYADTSVAPGPRSLCLSYPDALDAFDVEAPIQGAFAALIDALRDAGHEMIPVALADLDLGAFRRAGLMVCEADMLTTSAEWFAESAAVSSELTRLLHWVRGKSALDLARADNRLDLGARALSDLLAGVDAYLSPTAPQRPFPMTGPVPVSQADLTNLANMAGNPALSLPLPLDTGLPGGLQIVGQLGADEALLEIARLVVEDGGGRVLNHAVTSDRALP